MGRSLNDETVKGNNTFSCLCLCDKLNYKIPHHKPHPHFSTPLSLCHICLYHMSQPPPPPPPPPSSHLPLLPFSTSTTTTTTVSASSNREYRKGNWTIQETLVLITAKKLDDERRSKPNSVASTSSKPGELRWKWVENYCWAHGCYRSQNQCNDKWDNLLRDFKKVRDYQARSNASDNSFPSYWTMERHQRKYYNLPSNMSLEVFEALNEVVQRRYNTSITTTPQQQQHHHHVSTLRPPPPPPPPPPPVPVTGVLREVMPERVVMDSPAISGTFVSF